MKRWLIVGLLLGCGTSRACLNDRDTLAEEARLMQAQAQGVKGSGLPDVVSVVTGRFGRNPPQFYQMRIARVQEELKHNPRNFALYDDIAVAHDRIGQSGEALQWIERKRALLPAWDNLKRSDTASHEVWYRYYANAGTFWAHRWLRSGANRKRIGEMQRARDLIRRAVQIKPDAHFGREKYQLKAMEWIIKPPKVSRAMLAMAGPKSLITREALPNLLKLEDYNDPTRSYLAEQGYSDAITGLSGLIVLGDAWQSVDIFYVLSQALSVDGKNDLAVLARMRCRELIEAGRGSLLPGAPSGSRLSAAMWLQERNIGETPHAVTAGIYARLRREADDFQARRTTYITERLKAGRHPDTDKTFWDEWRDDGPPSLVPPTPGQIFWQEKGGALGVIGAAMAACLALLMATRRRARRLMA